MTDGNDDFWGTEINDAVSLLAGHDTAHGGLGDDLVHGGTGLDRLWGQDGNDKLYSDDDNDLLDGGNGLDLLDGGNGDDKLYGGTGFDTLNGGAGDDYLTGGAGRDIMHGDGGADVFVFAKVTDSSFRAKGRDIIDFHKSEHDQIDLHLLDADRHRRGIQDGDFIGRHAFTGESGEIRYAYHGHTTTVFGDFNGDKKADFAFDIEGHVKLTGADLLL